MGFCNYVILFMSDFYCGYKVVFCNSKIIKNIGGSV